MLAAHVPELEVDVRQRDGRHVLANGGYRLQVRMHVVAVLGFDLFEECRFAGVVKAEEENRVFCSPSGSVWVGFGTAEGGGACLLAFFAGRVQVDGLGEVIHGLFCVYGIVVMQAWVEEQRLS